MNTRRLSILTVPTLLILLAACGGSEDSRSALNAARDAGRRDALEVMSRDSSGMALEGGLIAIRARESELRAEGLERCADAYAAGAEAVIDSVLNN